MSKNQIMMSNRFWSIFIMLKIHIIIMVNEFMRMRAVVTIIGVVFIV